MLKSITYDVTIAVNNRRMSETIDFQKGYGTITGPNEAGKSFVIEMVRWAMFGSSALRGKVADFKKASVDLKFSVKGENYHVERTTTKAKLMRGDEEIAVGTTPVNDKVVQILGFGLAVFDSSCVANQGQIESLGTMKPAERKRMVDSVIGLGVIDDIAKTAGEEANSLRRQASDIAATTREPVCPEKPEGYRTPAEVEAELAAVSQAKDELARLKGWLSRPMTRPSAPNEEISIPSIELAELVTAQQAQQAALRRLEMELNTLPTPSPYSEAQLAAMETQNHDYDQWMAKKEWLKNPPPRYTNEQLDKMLIDLACNEEWFKANRLRKRIEDLADCGSHTCPNCEHNWAVEQSSIGKLRDELAQIDEAMMVYTEVDLRPEQIENERHKIQWWFDVVQPELAVLTGVVEVERPAVREAEIENHRNRNQFAAQRADLEGRVAQAKADLHGKPDWSDMLRKRQRYEDQLEAYQKSLGEYMIWEQEAQANRAACDALELQAATYDALRQVLQSSATYDSLLVRYEEDIRHYIGVMDNVLAIQTEAEQWSKARDALGNLRGLVKQHLMPSLNKVASHYLFQMTGGSRQVVYADEEFNILVDGQELNTLSGSGKAIACLALRLGLGQVLTNNVFSVFIGDEIDASMDKDRAGNTAYTLQTLKDRISQVLLITHKSPAADYYITVGKTNAPAEELIDA